MKSAKGWDYQADLSKHESQTDASKGFGGKYGVQSGNKDKVSHTHAYGCLITYTQSAVGWEYQAELSKHDSQKDGSKGFGGKYGVDKRNQDKVMQ